MSKNIIYKQEDIFRDIEGDEENILMTIPPEVCEKMGWSPGDTLSISVTEEGSISIKKVKDG